MATPRGALPVLPTKGVMGRPLLGSNSLRWQGTFQDSGKGCHDTTQQQTAKGNKMNRADKEVLIAIFRNGCRFGDSLSEMSAMTGYSVQHLSSVARKYDGIRFKGGYISYIGSQNGSMSKDSPGVKNPRTGICERIPATIAVIRRRKK